VSGPTALPFITHASNGAGLFILEDFPLIHLGSNKLQLEGADADDPNAIERVDIGQLGTVVRTATH